MREPRGKAPVRPEWLTVKEVAIQLNIGIQTVYEMVYRGELEAVRHGKPGSKKPALRVSVASIDAYLKRLRVSA